MRCDEVKERLVDLVYEERRAGTDDPELETHVRSCPACRQEMDELRRARAALSLWKDEAPLRPVLLPVPGKAVWWRDSFWPVARRVAMAAAVLLAFLAVTNAEVSWEKGRFSFRTSLLPATTSTSDSYTRQETRDLVRRALDDTESRMTETNYLMMQRLMDTMYQERWSDMYVVKARGSDSRRKN
jgi:predicted anti-sigma-YlaC factor YlaD